MKKLSLFLCALLLLGTLCFPAHAADGYELLENGDFESSLGLTWIPYYLGSVELTSDAHSGNSALLITNRQHYTDIARQYITKKLAFYGQGTYRISAYVRLADANAGPVDLQIAIGAYPGGGNSKTWATSAWTQITADKWTHVTAQVDVNWNGELESAEFYFITKDGQEGSNYLDLLIDDCSMKTVSYAGEEYAPETTAATTEAPTEAPTTEALITESPTESPTEQPTEQQVSTLPEQTESEKARIKTQTWIIAGGMYAGGVALLVCGAVLIFKKKEDSL